MKKFALFFVLIGPGITQSSLAQFKAVVARPDSIVKEIAQNYLHHSFQLLSEGIIEDGKTYLYNFGVAGHGEIIGEADSPVYEIGSITKSFASFLLARAVLDKKVRLEDDIRKYLKGSYPNLAYHGKPIELLHLVNLTSGLPNNMPESAELLKHQSEDAFAHTFVRLHRHYTKEIFLVDLHKVKIDTVPGLIPKHSNAAALLLTYILENIYHQSYESLVKKFITGPLRMPNTFVTASPDRIKFMATGHLENGSIMPYIPEDESGAFGMKSNIEDMTRWVRFHLQEKDAAVIMTHKAIWGDTSNFALGMNWFLNKTQDETRTIADDGTTLGFTDYILMYPSLRFAVILMTNQYSSTSNDTLGVLAGKIFERSFYTAAERASDGFGFSPSINLLLASLNKKGFEHAAEVFNELKANSPSFVLTENELNNWGYFLLGKNELQRALQIFKLNVSLHPESWNVYDSYGEALLKNGQKEEAIKMYKRSINLNPGNEGGKKVLAGLLNN